MQYFVENPSLWINVICDLEGVSGVVSFSADNAKDSPNYQRSLRLASGEINALVLGLRTSGADRITVIDGHGPGGLDIELISEPCEVMIGRPVQPGSSAWVVLPSKAQVLFGHHSMAGVKDANMAHTYSASIVHMKFNGQTIGEIGMEILLAGCKGVRTIMISGDQTACREAQQYVPDIITANVKQGLTTGAAFCLPPKCSQELIMAKAREAVENLDNIPLPQLPKPPYCVELQFISTQEAQTFYHVKKNFHPTVKFTLINDRTITWKTDELEWAISAFLIQGNACTAD